MDSDIEGVRPMSTKPAIRITAGSVPARRPCVVNVVLCGGHLDGLEISKVEVPGTWPTIVTLERWSGRRPGGGHDIDLAFIPRHYAVLLHDNGRPCTDRRHRVRYALEAS